MYKSSQSYRCVKLWLYYSCQYTHSVCSPRFLGPHDTLLWVLISLFVQPYKYINKLYIRKHPVTWVDYLNHHDHSYDGGLVLIVIRQLVKIFTTLYHQYDPYNLCPKVVGFVALKLAFGNSGNGKLKWSKWKLFTV